MLNFQVILFAICALLILGSCVGVLWTKNIMHCCVYLLGTLIGVSGLYLTLGADFVAATQLMVYVGGVVILMVFAVMLTGGQVIMTLKERVVPGMGNKLTYMTGAIISLVFLLTLSGLIRNVILQSSLSRQGEFGSSVEGIGRLLITDHILAFEVSSVLLLGALVGAAIIARPLKTLVSKGK